jgi:hypothetical protein
MYEVGRDCHCQDGVQVLFDVGLEKYVCFYPVCIHTV